MGACATKPKDLNIGPDSLPIDAPASPKKTEAEAVVVAQESVEEGRMKIEKEEALVDLSEPKQETGEDNDDSKVNDIFTPVKEIVEIPSEVKVEAEKEETTNEAIMDHGLQEVAAAAPTTEVKTDKLDAAPAPIAQNKDTPFVNILQLGISMQASFPYKKTMLDILPRLNTPGLDNATTRPNCKSAHKTRGQSTIIGQTSSERKSAKSGRKKRDDALFNDLFGKETENGPFKVPFNALFGKSSQPMDTKVLASDSDLEDPKQACEGIIDTEWANMCKKMKGKGEGSTRTKRRF